MKREHLLPLFAILCIFVVAVSALRPADPNPDFGNVPEVCRTRNWVEITDCEGDTHLLRAASYFVDEYSGVYVRFEGDSDFLLTTNHYVDGKLIDRSGADTNFGRVEKWVDDAWVFWGDIEPYLVMSGGTGGLATLEPMPNIQLFWNDPDSLNDGRQVLLPEFEYGAKYRITHYFKPCEYIIGAVSLREIASQGTPAELYSITHTVEIPAISNKRFDLVSLGLGFSPSEDGISGMGQIMPTLRVNHGEPPYWDAGASRLEVRTGGKWIPAVGEDGANAVKMPNVMGKAGDIYELREYMGEPQVYQTWQLFFDVADRNADYRLTLHFTEKPDGSGEQYTLTLNLRFDE